MARPKENGPKESTRKKAKFSGAKKKMARKCFNGWRKNT